jgi:hypothetical protein
MAAMILWRTEGGVKLDWAATGIGKQVMQSKEIATSLKGEGIEGPGRLGTGRSS